VPDESIVTIEGRDNHPDEGMAALRLGRRRLRIWSRFPGSRSRRTSGLVFIPSRSAEDSLTARSRSSLRSSTSSMYPRDAGGIGDPRGVIKENRPGSWRRGRAANGLFPDVRGVRRQPPSSSALREKKAGHTTLTKGLSPEDSLGGIHNRLLEELNREGTAILPYPLQRRLVRKPRDTSRGGGSSGSCASVGLGKVPIFRLATNAIGFFDLIG